jgi:hypothetical protein
LKTFGDAFLSVTGYAIKEAATDADEPGSAMRQFVDESLGFDYHVKLV